MTVLKAFFPLLVLSGGIANAQAPNSVPLSPAQIQAATNTAIATGVSGGITALSLNGILNQFDPFTNLWFDASNVQNGLLNKWSGTAWVPITVQPANGGTGLNAATVSSNNFLAGPSTGSPAAPTYRGLASADLTSPLLTPPPIGATTPNTGAFTTLTVTTVTATTVSGAIAGTTISASSTVSGTGFSTYLASPPPIGGTAPAAVSATTLSGGTGAFVMNATGSIAYTPTTAFGFGVVPGITQFYAATGSVGAATSATMNAFDLTTDNLTVNGAPGNASLALFSVYDFSFGGSAMSGGRLAGDFALLQSAVPASTSTFNDYIALHGTVTTTTGAGGGVGTEKGDYYGLWSSNILKSGATHVKALNGLEIDMEADAGSSVLYKAALLAGGSTANDAVHGSVVDTVLWVANSTGGVGANVGLLFGRSDGFGGLGVASTGTLIQVATETATVANGIDLTGGGSLTITGNAWKSPGASQTTIIDGNGNIKANTVNLPVGAAYSWGASLGGVTLSTNMYFDNLTPGDWVFRTTGPVEEFRISAAGVLSSVGTAGVTCAPASPTASFSTKGGIVTHC